MSAPPLNPGLIRRVYEALRSAYAEAQSSLLEPSRGNAVDVLVATILSQATNDTLSGRAFKALRESFSTWEEVLEADPREVEQILSVGGLQREKTKKIREALAKVKADFGRITLDPLKDRSAGQAFDYLTSLPGVGPKTAACVVGFGLCKPAFPVDTHVLRISRRLGLVPPRATAAKAQEALSAAVPLEIQMPMHLMMLKHGRAICRSRKPRCEACPLREVCRA